MRGELSLSSPLNRSLAASAHSGYCYDFEANSRRRDPVTAIGLASAILWFIDYAHKIVIGADELYKSITGATEENTYIDHIVKKIDKAAADLTDLSGKTKHEKALNILGTKYNDVSRELSCLLNKLAVSGNRSTWKILKVTIRSLRKEGEVKKMVAKLCEYRSQILLRLSLMFNEQQYSIRLQLDRLKNKELSLSTESAAQLTELRGDILKDVEQLPTKDNHEESGEFASEVWDGILEVQQSLKSLSSMMMAVPKENIILQNVFFSSMNIREYSMDMAEDGTFD